MKFRILFSFIVFIFSYGLVSAQNYNTISNTSGSANRQSTYAGNRAVNNSNRLSPEPPKTTISGRVIYEDTGKPMRRGQIKLIKLPARKSDDDNTSENFENEYNSQTITGDNGEFKMERISAGSYYLRAEVAGVLNPDTFGENFRVGNKISMEKLDAFFEKIIVSEGGGQQQVLIRVKRGAAISGRVLYSDGDPVIGARVEVLLKANFYFEGKTGYSSAEQTDDRGYYRLSGLPAGEYTVRVGELTFAKAALYYGRADTLGLKTYYGDTMNTSEAKSFEIALGEDKSEINITIPERKTFQISGALISKTAGGPISNARITLTRNSEEDTLSYPLLTSNVVLPDEKGKWLIQDLPKGAYTITVSTPYAFLDTDKSKQPNEIPFAETKKEFLIEDKDLENIIIELPPEAKISGTVTFEDKRKIGDLYIFAFDNEKEIYGNTRLNDKDGQNTQTDQTQKSFTISNLAEGSYDITVSQYLQKDSFYIKSIRSGNTDIQSSGLQLKEGAEIKDVQIVLATDVGTLKGKITSNDEKYLKSIQVILVSVAKPGAWSLIQGAEMNEKGEFQLKAAPGEYFIVVQPRDILINNRKLKHEEWLKMFTGDAEKVTVKAGAVQTVTINKN